MGKAGLQPSKTKSVSTSQRATCLSGIRVEIILGKMLVDDSTGDFHPVKRKKKRSFYQKQKRFAKNGNFGRGTQLSSDMHEYFINIMKVMNSKIKDEEEMRVLASNVFHEIQGKEAEYCCNQVISRVVENLLPFSSDEEFSGFVERFSENLRPIFSDTFGSHVLQQSLIVSFTKYKKLPMDNKLSVKFYEYILKVSNFLFNNLEDFIWDTYSNAVARTVFNVLSGQPVKGEVKVFDENSDGNAQEIPEEFKSVIVKYVKKILLWPQFNVLCTQPINSGFLQSLLFASKNCDECNMLVVKIIGDYEGNPRDLTEEENDPFVRLLEVVLFVANSESFKKIYKLMFKERLRELAVSKCGNFAVQKLILGCKSETVFGKVFAKLECHMEEILKVGHSGVLLAVVKMCRKFGILQADCMTMLSRTFQAKDTKELVPLICSLRPSENFNPETSTVTLHGCLVVQELLNFKKPINIVNSLLELPESKLVKLLSDVRGSHITDAFVKSPTIGEKSRDRLFKKLKGHYVELGTSKHGSRSLDAIWSVIHVQQKVILAEELKSKQSELCSDVYGNGFARKIHLDSFRRNKEEWIKLQKTSETAEKYFADIIPPKKRKMEQ